MASQFDRKKLPVVKIYPAREIITLDPDKPSATAVAVLGDRILAVGSVDELTLAADGQPYAIDETFVGKVITPGLIAQHDHPLLTGLTMVSEIIAIEDWVLPSGLVPAASSPIWVNDQFDLFGNFQRGAEYLSLFAWTECVVNGYLRLLTDLETQSGKQVGIDFLPASVGKVRSEAREPLGKT